MLTKIRKKYRYTKNLHRASSVVISFPKSGRTLLRFILGMYLKEFYSLDTSLKDITNFKKFHIRNNLPFTFFDHFGNPHLISHQKINNLNLKPLANKTKIFLHRDPRPQVYSNYFQFFYRGDYKKLINEPMPSKDIEKFIFGSIGGLKSISNYYKLIDNYQFNGNILYVPYKQLIGHKTETLVKILEALEYDVDEKIINKVITQSSKENMADLEKKGLLNDYFFGGTNNENSKVSTNRLKWNEFLSNNFVDKMNLYCSENFDKKFLEF